MSREVCEHLVPVEDDCMDCITEAAMSEQYRIEMTQFIAGDCPSCMRTPTEIWCVSAPGCVRIKLQANT